MSALSLWLSCLSCDASLPYLVWLGALYSHTFLYNEACCSSAQRTSCHSLADTKYFPCFLKTAFLSLASLFPPSSFTLTTRHVLMLHAFPSSVLLSSSPSHHLLSLSLNDLIPPMPLHLSSRVWSNFSVEVTRRVCGCDSTDSRWCQHELRC